MTSPSRPRQLGFFDTTMSVMGGIVGSGIFMNPQLVAKAVDRPSMVVAAWVVGGVIAILGAGIYAELAARRPRVGGQYVYLAEGVHPLAAFLYGWSLLLVIQSGAMAAVAVTFARYALQLVPFGLPESIVAVLTIGLLCVVNVFGVKAGGRTQSVLMVTKIAAIAGFVLLGLLAPSAGTAAAAAPPPLDAGAIPMFGAAMVPVMFAYGGWQTTTFLAGEMKDAERLLPRAILVGVTGVIVLYVSVTLGSLSALGLEGLATSPAPPSEIAGRVLGPSGATVMAAAIAISTLGWLSQGMLTAPRYYFAMARDGAFFEAVGREHPRTGAPVVAIVLQGAMACVIALWGGYATILNYVISVDFIFMGIAALSLFGLQAQDRRAGGVAPAYRAPGHPVTTLVFVVACWLVAGSAVYKDPGNAAIGLALLAAGVPVFFVWTRRRA
jgi:APA family basic amino acid/polyamine antiporter